MKFYLLFNTVKETGYSGEGAGGQYNMETGCKNCGTACKLIGNLPINAVKLKRDFIQTLDRDYLISDKLFSALNSVDVKIGRLLHILNSKSREELPYYHFNPQFTFPEMLPESEGIKTDDQCPVCKRNGFYDYRIYPKDDNGEIIVEQIKDVPRKYIYNIPDKTILEKSDIFFTWEHFGPSNLIASGNKVVGFARPRLIVSERVKSVFEKCSVKNTLFEEIFIQEK